MLLSISNLHLKLTKKLLDRYIGKFTIVKRVGSTGYNFFGFSWFKVIFVYTFHALYGYIKYKASKYKFFPGISNASCFT